MVKPWNLVKPVSATLVAGRHLTQQEGLPKLPVPSLQLSCELYLSYLEPILEAHELKHTKELVEEFQKAGGVGERLQKALEKKSASMENWVSLTNTPTARHLLKQWESALKLHMTKVYLIDLKNG